MRIEDFQTVEIQALGKYRLVPEDLLVELLRGATAQIVNVPTREELTLGYLVRNFRIDLGWTQAQLAANLNIHFQQVSKIEANKLKTKPHDDTLLALVAVFGDRFKEGLIALGYRMPERAA